MISIAKLQTNIKPKTFESLNNGIWYYNYDITESLVKFIDKYFDNEEKEELRYSFTQVRITGIPTPTKCYEAVLKKYIDENNISLYDSILHDNTYKDLADEIYYNIKVDFGLEEAISSLDKAKKTVLKKIEEYDHSSSVNSFFLNGIQVWLNKDTRVGLMNSLNIEKNSGKEESALWFDNMLIVINCDAAILMLSALELYALECYNKTAEHRKNIEGMESVEDITAYDYTEGYPAKLSFTI